jgi:transposase
MGWLCYRILGSPALCVLFARLFGVDNYIEDCNLHRKPTLPKRILPLIPAGLVVDQVLPSPDRIAIITSPRPEVAHCPTCAQSSTRVHSQYQRTLRDLPSHGRPVTLHVQVRRFRCLNPACLRQTFAAPLPDAAGRRARRTERLGDLQRHLGLALGGEAGMRLAERLAMPISADTLLRLARKASNDNELPSAPRVLAVDDWAWRRGHRYGTVLVDLERNVVVDLLPDRRAETLAEWLRQHPGIEIVARDRAGAYADGVRQGAPDATQVADRWHLLHNLGDAVRTIVDAQHAAVRRTAKQISDQVPAPSVAAPVPDNSLPTAAAGRHQASHARRQARYEEAARMLAAGVSIARIAGQLGAERKTIRRWLRTGRAPLWQQPRRESALARFCDHLERRWAEGCHNAARLWRELVDLGFTGRSGIVRRWASQRRKVDPLAIVGTTATPAMSGQPPSIRQLVRMLMADNDTLSETEQAFVAALLVQAPKLADAIALAKRLNQLLRRQSIDTLEQVLADAVGTLLEQFTASLRRDFAAVQAALDLPWTTSPAEGQINRLKMLKRTMYGRAGFQLLRARVLYAA